ncbi:MAG: (d)CMP kinase [candidate division WOR-3 bacterium]
MLIAIDGPSGVGKTTVAKKVAEKLGLKAVSTGAIYRAVAYAIKRENIPTYDLNALKDFLKGLNIDQKYENGEIKTYLNGEDITDKLDSPDISELSSEIAAITEIREYLLNIQRRIASDNAVVEGRDIGSVVLPYADVKVFLDASLEERIKRRYNYLRNKGINITLEEVRNEILGRDTRDRNRKTAPLVKPKDAFYIDTTYMTADEVVNKIIKIVKSLVV